MREMHVSRPSHPTFRRVRARWLHQVRRSLRLWQVHRTRPPVALMAADSAGRPGGPPEPGWSPNSLRRVRP
jgi:hypothetical protein